MEKKNLDSWSFKGDNDIELRSKRSGSQMASNEYINTEGLQPTGSYLTSNFGSVGPVLL